MEAYPFKNTANNGEIYMEKSVRNFVNQHKGKIVAATATVTTAISTASAAFDTNWTDYMTAGSAAISAGVSVMATYPFNYIVGTIVAIVGLKAVFNLFRKLM